jgi:hypothetical protein
MSRKTAAYLALLASRHFTMGCAANRVYGPGGGIAQLPSGFIEAKAFPELLLQTKGNAVIRSGKITGLENRLVRFLPAPYWNVEALRIDIAEISRIVLPQKGGGVGRAFAYGFGVSFIGFGALGGMASKYDSDYQGWLIAAPAAGAAVGLVAMAVSAISNSGKEKEIWYDLASMSDEEKTFAILKVMGFRR